MPLSESIINKIKVLIYENKKEEAEEVLRAEAGITEEEASSYLARLEESLPNTTSDKDKPKSNKTAAFIVMGVAFCMWGLAVFFYVEKDRQLDNSYIATGIVVDYIVGEGLAPVIAYEIDGSQYRYTSNIYSTPAPYELNESVEIYISKDDPNSVIINSFSNKWLIVTIFASFGLVLDLIGLLLLKLKSTGRSSEINFIDTDKDSLSQLDE